MFAEEYVFHISQLVFTAQMQQIISTKSILQFSLSY